MSTTDDPEAFVAIGSSRSSAADLRSEAFEEDVHLGDVLQTFPGLFDREIVEGASWSAGEAPFDPQGFAFCIPACDEEERIERTLSGVAAVLRPGDGIVLVVNGSIDRTAEVARRFLRKQVAAWRLLEVSWHGGCGSAPAARRIALDLGARLVPDGILVSTDADTVPAPDLREAYVREFERGVDLVCGALDFDPAEAARMPPADGELEFVVREYRAVSREIAALIDPDPDNPWPHHGNIGGANFAIRAAPYRAIGGLPTPASGEDRALLRKVEAAALRVRFSEAARAVTSCRLVGNARGGLSDELRRSRLEADPLADEALEPAAILERRLRFRAACRRTFDAASRREALRPCGLSAADMETALAFASPIAGWYFAEEKSPLLARRSMRVSDLKRKLPPLLELRDRLRSASRDRS